MDYSLYFIGKKKNDSTLGILVCMTLNFLMYRRNERKKEGEENRGTHPRVSLFHSHRPTLIIIRSPLLPLSLFFSSERLPFSFLFVSFLSFFLFFSFFTLPSNKEDLPDDDSLPRYYCTPISLMIDTHWIYLRGEPATLHSIIFFLFRSFSFFILFFSFCLFF